MSKSYLYVYTTNTYYQKGWIKVGQSKSPNKRMQQSKTGVPESLMPLIKPLELPENITDQLIHRELINQGIQQVRRGGGNEWFKATVDDVRRAFNSITIGHKRAKDFQPRSDQKKAIEKAVKWFSGGYSNSKYRKASHQNRFLINAKMRFGKCLAGISIAKKLKAKKVLIITYKPEVFDGWLEILNDHINFVDWVGILAKRNKCSKTKYISNDGKLPKISSRKSFAVCISLQDMDLTKREEIKKRIKSFTKIKWDLVIFDEVHFGGFTERIEKTLNMLKHKKRLDLSGTPFRLLEHIDFCKEQIFTYSYLDEQRNKKEEISSAFNESRSTSIVYRAFPDLQISTIDITKKDLNSDLQKYYNKDLKFSLNKLFEASKGEFVNEEAVDSFLNGLHKKGLRARSISVYGALANPSRLNLPTKRHSIWWVDSVATAEAFAKKLRNHDYFKHFEIINASGSGKRNMEEKSIEKKESVVTKELTKLKAAIKRSKKDEGSKGTITITVKRFLTGITVKEWDSILILNDIEAPEDYYQAIFRIQSPWKSSSGKILKPKSWAFDFSISRCLNMKNSISNAINDTSSDDEDIDDNLNNICRSFFLERFVDGKLDSNKVTSDDILSVLNTSYAKNSLARRITSEALVCRVPYNTISNPDIRKILESIKGYRKQDLNSRAILKRVGPLESDPSVRKKIEKKDSKLNQTQKEIIWASEQVVKLSISITDFIYMTKKREKCISDVIKTNKWKLFKEVTGISKENFRLFCKERIIREEKLNQIVRDFRVQEISSLNVEEFIDKEVSRLTS